MKLAFYVKCIFKEIPHTPFTFPKNIMKEDPLSLKQEGFQKSPDNGSDIGEGTATFSLPKLSSVNIAHLELRI